MRLNIILLTTMLSVNMVWAQIEIKEQKFDREKLEFHIFLLNKGKEAVSIEAIGIASSYLTLDVCDRAEKKTHLPESHTVDFEVDRPETIRDLLKPIKLLPGEERGVVITANPLPESICDYWEVDIRAVLGFSNMDKWYASVVTISEDDYYNFNDWLDQKEKNEGKKFVFKPDRQSRLQLAEWLQDEDKNNIIKALKGLNDYFWPAEELKTLINPLLVHQDSVVQSQTELAFKQQEQKYLSAIEMLKAPSNFSNSQKKEVIEGLGLVAKKETASAILDFWENDTEMEPYLVARTLMQIHEMNMLPRLEDLAKKFRQSAAEKRGFSHERWKWLTTSALLANYGNEKALPIIENCLRAVIDNYEYPELRLILEAIGRSSNESVKKALTSYYKEAMAVNFSNDLTIAILPLYIAFVEADQQHKASALKAYLGSKNTQLRRLAISLSGKHRLKDLQTDLQKMLNTAPSWEDRYLLTKSLNLLKK